MPRFVLLEHTGAPDDPAGRHYDLLLEAGEACRTWRLTEMPVANGPPVTAVELPPHRLAWLDHLAGEVSGGRGFARRIAAGTYHVSLSDAARLMDATRCSIVLTSGDERTPLDLTRDAAAWTVSASQPLTSSPTG